LTSSDWHSAEIGVGERILGPGSDWTNFVLTGGGDSTANGHMRWMLSSVPSSGIESNGFVAGFNLKF
jgi:hypothetical protein